MTAFTKRVVFTMGGKGGVGKTGVIVALAEWFTANEIPVTLLDLDTENKARGSLKHFFNGTVTKVNIHTPAGRRSFLLTWARALGRSQPIGSSRCTTMWLRPVCDLRRLALSRLIPPASRAYLPGRAACKSGSSM